MFHVQLCRFGCVMLGMMHMTLCRVRVVSRRLMISGLVMPCGFAVVLGSMFQVFRYFVVMFRRLL